MRSSTKCRTKYCLAVLNFKGLFSCLGDEKTDTTRVCIKCEAKEEEKFAHLSVKTWSRGTG